MQEKSNHFICEHSKNIYKYKHFMQEKTNHSKNIYKYKHTVFSGNIQKTYRLFRKKKIY